MAFNEQTDLMTGNDIMLYIGGNVVAYGKSCDISSSAAETDSTSKFSGRMKTSRPGQVAYTISSDFMYTPTISGSTTYGTLLASQLAGSVINWEIGLTTDSTTFAKTDSMFSGTAIITSLSAKFSNNELVGCSITLGGTGDLTVA